MSYILDALKKSEEKRNALNVPAAAVPRGQLQGTKNNHLQWVVFALLLAAGSVWFITRPLQPEMVPATADHSPAIQTVAVVTEKNRPQPEPEPEQAAKPLTTQPSEQTAKSGQTIARQKNLIEPAKTMPVRIVPASPDPITAEHTSPPDHLAEVEESAVADKPVPNRSDLPLEKQLALPEITIAGHIYDKSPSARMVVINGKVRREKQHFGDGLILKEITTNGIILNHHGTVFRVGVFD